METIKRYSKLALTGDLEIQMTCNKTIWKAYELVYNSFLDLKHDSNLYQLEFIIQQNSVLTRQRVSKLEPNFKQL